MEELRKENEYLKKRIEFLEMIIEVNQETITKSINTNAKLIDWLEANFPQK